MNLEEFESLNPEEKAAYLQTAADNKKALEDVTAERDSFKSENSELRNNLDNNSKELKATKELNFTLARKINVVDKTDPETELYDFIKEFRK